MALFAFELLFAAMWDQMTCDIDDPNQFKLWLSNKHKLAQYATYDFLQGYTIKLFGQHDDETVWEQEILNHLKSEYEEKHKLELIPSQLSRIRGAYYDARKIVEASCV